MKARYLGEEGGDATCVAFGLSFPTGEWVEIGKDQQRLVGNPMFETDADEDGDADPTVEVMKERLTALGVTFHHKAGAAKLAALLAEHDT